jgi:cytochrome c oxidase assembly factor CtaG
MNPTFDAVARSWPFEPWVALALVATGWIYWRGWRDLRRRDPVRWHGGRLAAFAGGLAALFLALASPIEPFAALSLQVHMLQHLLLMMAAPPLLWLGWPLLPLLRGLPPPIRAVWVAPLFRWQALRTVLGWLTHPWPALVLFTAATWLWHAPAVYEAALRDTTWHRWQHLTFLGTGMLFWYPVVRPYPLRPRWSVWLLIPFLIAADVQNTALSALLTFSDHVLYPYYAELPPLSAATALDDQAAAGVLMWVPGSLAFLGPLFAIVLRLLFAPAPQRRPVLPLASGRLALPVVAVGQVEVDVLRWPLVGRFLRWRHARLAMQVPLVLAAALVIVDGFSGPPVAAMNLAGVLPWVHWRALVVVGLLAAGNVFCMACPFMLPRTIARRWLPGRLPWPRWLRGKWLAIGLLAVFLWSYEAFALWDRPALTAGLAIGYFAAALAVDGTFRGAAFCKYVCPIGQFHFVQSLVSPLEVRVRDAAVCRNCRTKDCIRGRDGIPGCELHLFQPRKAGNLDCTFCLDCVHACPHDNIAMAAGVPGSDLWRDPQRSGVGRLSRRPDVAALVVLLTFGAVANAAGMVAPVAAWQERLGRALGGNHLVCVSLYYAVALVALPTALMASAGWLTRKLGDARGRWWQAATPLAYCLVPLGFAMWLAHYTFHFVTGWEGLGPVVQRFVADWGAPLLGEPDWVYTCCLPVAGWLVRLEFLFLDVGLLLSLYTGWRIAQRFPRPLGALLPWAVLLVGLFAFGVWVLLQPMEMRGMLMP